MGNRSGSDWLKTWQRRATTWAAEAEGMEWNASSVTPDAL
jgi:hypothetical protein